MNSLMTTLAGGLRRIGWTLVGVALSVPAFAINSTTDLAGEANHWGTEITSTEHLIIAIAQLAGLCGVVAAIVVFIKARNEGSRDTYGKAGVLFLGGLAFWWVPVLIGIGSATIFM